jgi:ribosomal protein L14
MIFKKTWLTTADNTNIRWMQTFHLYKGFHRKSTSISFFIKSSARVVEPPRIEYKGFKFKFHKKGDICRSLLVRTIFTLKNTIGNKIYFSTNDACLIRKRQDFKSNYFYGPTSRLIRRKRISQLMPLVL